MAGPKGRIGRSPREGQRNYVILFRLKGPPLHYAFGCKCKWRDHNCTRNQETLLFLAGTVLPLELSKDFGFYGLSEQNI